MNPLITEERDEPRRLDNSHEAAAQRRARLQNYINEVGVTTIKNTVALFGPSVSFPTVHVPAGGAVVGPSVTYTPKFIYGPELKIPPRIKDFKVAATYEPCVVCGERTQARHTDPTGSFSLFGPHPHVALHMRCAYRSNFCGRQRKGMNRHDRKRAGVPRPPRTEDRAVEDDDYPVSWDHEDDVEADADENGAF